MNLFKDSLFKDEKCEHPHVGLLVGKSLVFKHCHFEFEPTHISRNFSHQQGILLFQQDNMIVMIA